MSTKTGIIINNLGTPNSPTTQDVRRYLAQFLSDRRVIESPRWLWNILLHGILLRTRPKWVAKNYQKIWTDDGSPLLSITETLTRALQHEIQNKFGDDYLVETAMCYGNPSIPSTIKKLIEKKVERLIVLPMYPQYSATTTAATFDAVFRTLQKCRYVPALTLINNYHENDLYLDAIVASIESHWESEGKSEILLFSFHGLPLSYINAGDPYREQCEKTTVELVKRLGLEQTEWRLCFQSRLGKLEWIKPYTDKTIIELAQNGTRSIDVICPGFSVDCLETLEEIDIQNRRFFIENGGESFSYIPALNDSRAHIDMVSEIISKNLPGL